MNTLVKTLTLAVSKIGFKELTGNNDGAFVDECMALTGLDNQKQIKSTGKGYAWCAGFVSWVFFRAGVPNAIKNAWAPAWFPPNKLVKNGKYRPMDVVGINFNGITNGHVCFMFYWPDDGDTFLTLDGNWGNQVAINVRKKAELNAVARWI